MKIRIHTKLMLGVALGVTAIVLAVSTVAYRIARAGLVRQVTAHLVSVAESRAAHVETFLAEHKDVIQAAATSQVLAAGLRDLGARGTDRSSIVQGLNERMRLFLDVDEDLFEVLLLDRHGRVAASSAPVEIGVDMSTDAGFLGAQDGPFIKDAYLDASTGRQSLAFSAPLFDPEDEGLLGVLVFEIDTAPLSAIATDRKGLGTTGETYLINKYGFMITPSRFQEEAFLKAKVDTENGRQCLRGMAATRWGRLAEHHEHTVKVFADYRGGRVLGLHAHVPEMSWGLLAEIAAAEAFAPVTSLGRALFACAVLFAAVALGAAFVVARRLSRPIHQLHAGAERIGEGELGHRLHIKTGDEIEQLADEFNRMAARLADSYASLERKVAERTAHLEMEIAERHRAQREVEALNQRIEFILGATKTGIDIIDSEFNIRYIDPKWQEVYGDPAGRKCYDYFMGRGEVCPGCGIVEALKTKAVAVTEERLVKENNRPIQVTTRPFQDDDGQWLVAEVNVDITERKRAEEQLQRYAEQLKSLNAELERSNRDLEDFTHTVSHDLQEPVRSIQAFGRFLLADCGDQVSEQGREHLSRMQEAARRMKELIQHLLALAGVGTQGGELVPADSAQILSEVLEALSQRIEACAAEVTVRDDLPVVQADPMQLGQVFQNLLGNALKFSSPERLPRITVSAQVEGDQVTFSVTDNGIGIEQKYCERIFGIFQRLHPREEHEGVGVGLALCEKIVRRHGGKIWAESEPGKGTTFRFTLPVTPARTGEEP